ncbi:uncharacterized protein LOC106150908 [Lingula anatina]|uniref:Uncharacterized protein LOC106150908 n=1 Tax=Lingula anatina TaxID=7574 RepID=A0A1S3GZT8_LINAN|nr:uncharacterized protein LOC106150908 [Lingula anatina]|eukprot:XP_013379390.1 uncharacterized protein LOC106150908 [Lingula anatina]
MNTYVLLAMCFSLALAAPPPIKSMRTKRAVPNQEDFCTCMKFQCLVEQGNNVRYEITCEAAYIKGELGPECSRVQETHPFSSIIRCNPCCDLNGKREFPGIGTFTCGQLMKADPNYKPSQYLTCAGINMD